MNTPSLKESLERWTRPQKLPHPFHPRRTRKASAEAAKALGDVKPRKPPVYDLEILRHRVVESWHRDRSLSRIEPRDLRRLPWILYYPPGQKRTAWLGAEPRILEAYGRWVSDGHRTRSVLALLHEFLSVYPTDLATFDALRQLLQDAVEGGHSAPPSFQKWRKRCMHWELLRKRGDRSFVENLVSASDAVDDILDQAGLEAGLARCGFLKSGLRTYLPRAETLLNQNRLDAARLGRLLTLLECEGNLRFDDWAMRSEVATALLRPFVERPPESTTKERLQPFFLRHFRDPRLGSGKHKWSRVPDEIRRVVIRWLVERALEQFFLLVKETALDRHWRYREAFWRAFHREGLIDDIWFVLGRRAKVSLRKMNEKNDETETSADLRGAQGDQSVLLLRMPGVTIAEWSHNGSCRMWLDGNRNTPKMYQGKVYLGDDLRRGSDFWQRHVGSEYGRWQDEIARWLRDNTGVEIDRAAYFPVRLRERKADFHPYDTPSARGSRPQAAPSSSPGSPSQTHRTATSAAAFRELQKVRDAVMTSRKLRVDLRAFMDATSPAWAAYVAEHGVPGYGTRGKVVLDRLDSMIRHQRFIIERSKSRI